MRLDKSATAMFAMRRLVGDRSGRNDKIMYNNKIFPKMPQRTTGKNADTFVIISVVSFTSHMSFMKLKLAVSI